MDYIYDVFISYSTDDKKIAEGVCGFLEINGIRCFVAYRDINPGVPWPTIIPDAIKSSKIMVALFSSTFNISKQTDREITVASEANIPILTYKLSSDVMTGTKEYYLTNLHWIDAFPYPEQHFGKLLNSINKLLSLPDYDEVGKVCFAANNTEHSKDELISIIKQKKTYDSYQPFLLVIDDKFSLKDRGTVVTGNIESGTINVGDKVDIIGYGGKLPTVCVGIEKSRKLVDKAFAGEAVGLLLRGIDDNEIYRGQVVAHPNYISESNAFGCDCLFIDKIDNFQSLSFWIWNEEVIGRVELPLDIQSINPDDYLPLKVVLNKSVPLKKGKTFAIRTNQRKTIGCGIVNIVL